METLLQPDSARTAAPQTHPLPPSLPPAILARLAAEGIESIEQWLGLGRQRRMLFGITKKYIIEVDAAVEAVLRGAR